MMTQDEIELLIRLEGYEGTAYDDTEGNRTVGIGFNMDAAGSRHTWDDVHVEEDFDKVYGMEEELCMDCSVLLADRAWSYAKELAEERCEQLSYDWNQFSEYKQFVITDVAYNTGGVQGWVKIFAKEGKELLVEARRKQREIDSRIAKIGKWFGIIDSVEEAREIGLTEARYV